MGTGRSLSSSRSLGSGGLPPATLCRGGLWTSLASLGDRDLAFSRPSLLGSLLVLLPSLCFGRPLFATAVGGSVLTRLKSLGERDLALAPSPLGDTSSLGWA